MYEIGNGSMTSPGNYTYLFSTGGFQGARGDKVGEDFYIENVFEELDSPNEWFFNSTTQLLYLWYNGTGAPPAKTAYVVTNLKVLLNITGTQASPVKGVTLSGLGFRDTAYTYLDPHGMPSGGDWALQRTAAVFLQGTENSVIEDSVFSRLDGNALMLSAYNRGAVIQRNEFAWIGDTAIAQWGNTVGVPEVPGMGWDGTTGDQPRGTQILYNFVHELGIWEKQSSFYFQAKSAQTQLFGNIFFNGPRAGINFNDGFGGANNVSYNILFNTCRESGDHGPINSWDRQVYVTDVSGQPSVIKVVDEIGHNFILGNYNTFSPIDTDDGSCYFEVHHNVLTYGGLGQKADIGGHDVVWHHNLVAYLGTSMLLWNGFYENHWDVNYNNTVLLQNDGNYTSAAWGTFNCISPADGGIIIFNNTVYSPTGAVLECGVPLKEWQAQGGWHDLGTTAAPYPSDDVILAQARQLLNL